ncbi:hypothetical protein J6590_004677 [Homalodisca vitripennis]|nr:hypothetical protein J6590_004677 [Homalodisca vitripennis]
MPEELPPSRMGASIGTSNNSLQLYYIAAFAPLVLRGACPQCSDQETKQIQRVLSHIQRNYPKEWSKIIQQYATGS